MQYALPSTDWGEHWSLRLQHTSQVLQWVGGGEDFTLKVFTFHTKPAFGDSSPTRPESECFLATPTPPPRTGGRFLGQASKVYNSEKIISTRAGHHQGSFATVLCPPSPAGSKSFTACIQALLSTLSGWLAGVYFSAAIITIFRSA